MNDRRCDAQTGLRSVGGAVSGLETRTPPLVGPGEILGGDLEIRAMLGEGGMGQVYEAQDLVLNRRVAVKIALPDSRASLRAEAQALAALRHPSLAAIYAFRRERDLEYVVMERIYGSALDEYADTRIAAGKPFDADEMLDILIGISEGLGAVHRAGLVHRDVKPANVILAPDNRIVLTDLGIFQVEGMPSGGPYVAGSPHYMAPELIAGTVALGEAYLVDLYALGVLAFELATGDVPFDAEESTRVLWMHLVDPPPRLDEHRSDLPEGLTTLVAEMLAKDPSERPGSAEEIAWRLGKIKARETAATRSSAPAARLESA